MAKAAYAATAVNKEMCQKYFKQDFELTKKPCADQKLSGVAVKELGNIIRKKKLITLRILRLSFPMLQKIAVYIDFQKRFNPQHPNERRN